MKHPYYLLIIGILFCSCSAANAGSNVVETDPPAIIPLPKQVSWGNEAYLIPENNSLCFNEDAREVSQWLVELLEEAGKEVTTQAGTNCGNWELLVKEDLKSQLGEEGYKLSVSDRGVSLTAATDTGIFYGIQTLRQMFPPGIENDDLEKKDLRLRHVDIVDEPYFEWRGTMVDVARSFFGLEYLKRHVDRMALYKLNRLHLHLTDDQGWRIEIKSRPLLTEVGSKGSVTGGNAGYLTQKEYIELQKYAEARKITIIPEVDMPGHIYAALVAYPELNCEGNSNIDPALATPPDLYSGYEVGWSSLCLEKPEVYDFVSEVIGELSEITKGPWIHIGGDEIEHDRYEEFVVKADSIVRSYGKQSIGWEEVTKALVHTSMISQQWHGKVDAVVETPVIESICSSFYLDHANVPGQENTLNWCKEDGVSLENVYSFRSNNPRSLGVEAPVWTEHVLNDQMLDDRFWPRTLAVAEVGWSQPEARSYEQFFKRLQEQVPRLRNMGIHHHPTPGLDLEGAEINTAPSSVFSGFEVK